MASWILVISYGHILQTALEKLPCKFHLHFTKCYRELFPDHLQSAFSQYLHGFMQLLFCRRTLIKGLLLQIFCGRAAFTGHSKKVFKKCLFSFLIFIGVIFATCRTFCKSITRTKAKSRVFKNGFADVVELLFNIVFLLLFQYSRHFISRDGFVTLNFHFTRLKKAFFLLHYSLRRVMGMSFYRITFVMTPSRYLSIHTWFSNKKTPYW